MQVNLKDMAAGTIFVVIGGLFAASSLFDLDLGTAHARAWGCDLTEGYVQENAAYYSS